ncbi:carboxymuconolactone decarboxylase family protein [Gordonia sp. VNK21]|uniref:carboxymuconolactone decarboxylase family protein n=1 Tax=Gordonia sp. VNK21 TaxID=3382483 RepID=UPI0038D4094A
MPESVHTPYAGRWLTPTTPRLEPLAPAELSRRDRLVLAVIRKRTRSGFDFTVFRTLARLRGVFGVHAALVGQLLRPGHLNADEKELVILRSAWRLGCIYEWAHHSHIADELGVEPDRRAAVTSDPVRGLDPRLTAMLQAADVLIAERRLDDDAWTAASRVLTGDEILELCFLVGHYAMVAMTINSVGVQLEEPFLPYATPYPGPGTAESDAGSEVTR